MAAILSQAVAAAAVQQKIVANVWSIVGLSWNSAWWIDSQDAGQTTLDFSVPAPALGGTVYYTADFQIRAA